MLENKDVDLRVLQPIVSETKAAGIAQKRPSVENSEIKIKKNKMEKFDILFGDEDVDLRQLPQVEDAQNLAPPLTSSSEIPSIDTAELCPIAAVSPTMSPKQKDWAEVKETKIVTPEESKKPSQLDLVRAKLAEATKGKDRLGRPLLFHSTSGERRRTISSEDIDLRPTQNPLDAESDKESIKIIMSQAEEQFKVGNINKEEYKTLVMQVLQLNERLKLKEAKQRESLEVSKRKLQKASQHSDEEMDISVSPNRSPQTDHNTFGDIDERITPHGLTINRDNLRFETPILNMPSNQPDIGAPGAQDSDLRVPTMAPNDIGQNTMIPAPPRPPIMPPIFMNPYSGMRRGPRPRPEEFNGPRMRGRHLAPPAFSRGKFTQWNSRFDPRMPALPRPILGTCQGECPLRSYNRSYSPPPLGAAGKGIPPTDFRLIEYIDQDPMKTIDIDGIPREIRFYGNTAVIMLEWDDPREIKFLPGTRRITFDNKDSVVLGFNEDYTNVDIDDHEFRIKYGAPTRELYINDRWYECFFGGPPMGIVIDGKPKVIQLEGPPPQVDIGKDKKTNLVAGKINLIVDGQHMFPVFLDAKPQKFNINGTFITLRFVDSLKTVLINEKPFKIEFGGLPKPIFLGKQKHFIRFSVLPRCVKPGHVKIENMEGRTPDDEINLTENKNVENDHEKTMETDNVEEQNRPEKILSPEAENSNPGGLDILASLMPSSMAPASQFSAGYSLAEPLMPTDTNKIPGLDTPADENPPLTNVSFVNDLFAKLVASGIVQVPNVEVKKVEDKPLETKDVEEPKSKPMKEDKNTVNRVDFLRPTTLKIKQPGLVARLYGGMQCSGCGTRFPPEHTVRYSQHLDWHFRQNRRERDSARRAHSRHWHYDLSDWVQYEEIEDLEEREKNWFETGGVEGEAEGIVEVPEGEAPSVPAGAPEDQHCALCGDKFDQFYNEDKEEWHLRKAVRHEDKNYHPLCFEDYKASLTKEEPSVVEINDTTMEESDVTEKIIEETIEIKDVDEINSQSDNESVVEVIESESLKDESQEPLEIPDELEDTEMKELNKEEVNFDDGDEDDVVLKADPVEQVVVDDDADTDDETQAERAERDRLAAIDFSKVKVKIEPIDPAESSNLSNIEHRAVIKYFVKKGKTPKEIFEDMVSVLQESAPSYTIVKKWARLFQQGRESFGDNIDKICDRIVTVDETWVRQYDPESKQKSLQWTKKGERPPKKFKVQKSASKLMATIFWDSEGVLLIDYLPKGTTMNGQYYANLLAQTREAVVQKRRGKLSRVVLFLQDIASVHTARVSRQALKDTGFSEIDHHPTAQI
ncbi:Pre-mRNA cleavage complex 2 protein Pcf11 [Eumeta japonica]|uniref:Pre-mRNA cleavage complex 2 protein Pcf11 n=1 Tax=Eumeta variegata TaxID=151549 RepID=A0A4C1YJ64_EUMVA|nr:Pre-mRNA cleavage complex 2 protein Pcf11 [Eumeta japonica]